MADRIVVMNQGAIEQIGTPLEIYRSPASAFVADFIGVMNFVAGSVVRDGALRLGQTELSCEVDGLAPGTPVTLAIRPEELVIGTAARQAENSLTMRVTAVQFLGAFTRLALVLPGGESASIECDVAAGALADVGAKEGSELALALPPAVLRVFRA